MATPTKHAICSASSSERWLRCTASPRFEEQFPVGSTDYTEEGTLAHSICELTARKKFSGLSTRKYNSEIKKLESDPLFSEEMLRTAEFYVERLYEKFMVFTNPPFTAFEIQVDFSEYVPEGFGTCDCVMIGANTLCITDYKHGKGVTVSANNNSQMKLYALGALKLFGPLYSIESVVLEIIQPRISEEPNVFELSVSDLLAWGDEIRPRAAKAYMGLGEFVAGDWCRFCRGKNVCKARAQNYTALEDFKDFIPESSKSEDAKTVSTDVLSDAEVSDLLTRGAGLVEWYNGLVDYAVQAILQGRSIPGYKVVAGKSNRAFTNVDDAFKVLRDNGYKDEMLYERKPITLSEVEKLLGKKTFSNLLGGYIVKPLGKPTLADISDVRPNYSTAETDFKDVENKNV